MSATEYLMEYIEACLTYYKHSYQHKKRTRTTSVVARSFKGMNRRTKEMRYNNEQRVLAMAMQADKRTITIFNKVEWSNCASAKAVLEILKKRLDTTSQQKNLIFYV